KHILRSTSFSKPVILVGNLTTGGTGKTPCVEYIVRLLRQEQHLAVISRGYKRKTKGFIIGNENHSWKEIGDEPLQIATKFPDVTVAVDGKRKRGIKKLLHSSHPPDCIIMDDGFQHRKVKAGLSILLTDYSHPYSDDYLLPAGNLREHISNRRRADIIVVTKSPAVKSPISDKILLKKLKPLQHQLVFFSYLKFGPFTPLLHNSEIKKACKTPNTIVLFTGIANPSSLQQHLQDQCSKLITLAFPDHHPFTAKDISKVLSTFNDQFTRNKILVTTEKDYHRMKDYVFFGDLAKYPVFYIPVYVGFHTNYRGLEFDQVIREYVSRNK
ncbi:MAG: tetraacyldisaccharide 4'-kinase, partial [Bacteroidales bacterium]